MIRSKIISFSDINEKRRKASLEFLQQHNYDLSNLSISIVELFGVDLSGVKFSGSTFNMVTIENCTNVDIASLIEAENISNVTFRNQDLVGLSFPGSRCLGITIESCTNVDMASLNEAENISNVTFRNQDLGGLSFAGKHCGGMTIENCTNVDIAGLNNATMNTMTFKNQDFGGFSFPGKDCLFMTIENCTNVDMASLNKVTIKYMTFKNQDLGGFSFAGKDCKYMTIENCTKVDIASLNEATIRYMTFKNQDLGGLSFAGRMCQCQSMTIENCTNVDIASRNGATSSSMTFKNQDVGGLSFAEKDWRGITIDNCQINNIKIKALFQAKNLPGILANYAVFLFHKELKGKAETFSRTDILAILPVIIKSVNEDMTIEEIDACLAENNLRIEDISNFYYYEQNHHLDGYDFPQGRTTTIEVLPKGKVVQKTNTVLNETQTKEYFSWVEKLSLALKNKTPKEREKYFEDKLDGIISGYKQGPEEGLGIEQKLIRVMSIALEFSGSKRLFPEEIRVLMLQYHLIFERKIEDYIIQTQDNQGAKDTTESEEERKWRKYDTQLAELQLLWEETLKEDTVRKLLEKSNGFAEKELTSLLEKVNDLLLKIITKEANGIKIAWEKKRNPREVPDKHNPGEMVKVPGLAGIINKPDIAEDEKIKLIRKALKASGIPEDRIPLTLLSIAEYDAIIEQFIQDTIDAEYAKGKKETLSLRDIYGIIMSRDIEFVHQERNKFTIEKLSRGEARNNLLSYLEQKYSDKDFRGIIERNQEGFAHYTSEINKSKIKIEEITKKLKSVGIDITSDSQLKDLVYLSINRGIEEEKTQIVAEFSKKEEDVKARESAGVCVSGDLEMWQRDSYLELVLRDKVSGELMGTVMLEMVEENGQKSLIFCPNPSEELLNKADNTKIFEELFKIVVGFAKSNGVVRIVRDETNGAYSNRVNFPEFIRASDRHNGDRYKFSKPVNFSSSYIMQDMIVLWENSVGIPKAGVSAGSMVNKLISELRRLARSMRSIMD